jgi:hypothetical protein
LRYLAVSGPAAFEQQVGWCFRHRIGRDGSKTRQWGASHFGKLAGLQIYGIDVHDEGQKEIGSFDIEKSSGAVNPEGLGIIVPR